jgi:hypothetical protein
LSAESDYKESTVSLIITKAGLLALSAAETSGAKLQATHMAVGDGSGQPPEHTNASTALVNEVWRGALDAITLREDGQTESGQAVEFRAHIPMTTGGWYIREVAIYADDVLLAIGAHPVMWKPSPDDPTKLEHTIYAPVVFGNAATLALTIDPSKVLATQQAVDEAVAAHNVSPNAHGNVFKALDDHIGDQNDPHATLPPGGDPGQTIIKQTDGGLAWGAVAGMPVGALLFSTTGTPLPGTVAVNVKQKFTLGTYPQLEAWVRSCGGYLATEAEWDAEAAAQEGSCGKYCLTDTHIILPCYRHYFSAAQNGAAGKAAGDWAGDAIRNLTGELKSSTSPNSLFPSLRDTASATGVFQVNAEDLGGRIDQSVNTYIAAERVIFDASRVVPTAEENRPKTSYLLPCIKAFDVAVNTAQVDMQALAAQVSAINGNKVDRSEWTQSLGESGWQRLPSGLILQWGTGSVSTGVATEVTLPIAYPNAHLSCVAVIGIDYGSVGNDAIAVYNRMAGKFTLKGEHSGSTVMPYSYISIGY